MKKIFKCYLLIIFLFLIFTFNVDAIVNYTGSGTANYFGSGTSGKCTGRYCLKLSNILKFTLVKLDSNGEIQRIGVSNGYYMIRRWGETANTYENRFINDNDAGSKLIYGIIEHGGSYNQNAYGFTELKNVFSNIHKILPVKGGTDFSDNNLRDAIIGRNGIETYEYKKVVLEILKDAIPDEYEMYSNFDDIPNEKKSSFASYRILIEPVYALGASDDYNFIFATPKAIGIMANKIPSCKSNYNCYGFEVTNSKNELLDNVRGINANGTYESFGNINVPEYKGFDKNNAWDALADPNNSAGYVIVQLTYEDIPETKNCVIEENAEHGFMFYINNINYYESGDGSSTKFLIDKCCTELKNSPYKDDILEKDEYKKYFEDNQVCNPPEDTTSKKCAYDLITSNYTFYRSDGTTTNDYGDFVKSCGCNNESVSDLSTVFSDEYEKQGCNNQKEKKSDGKLSFCSISPVEDYNLSLINIEKFTNENIECKRECKEEIKFYNVFNTSNTTYASGQYFKLDHYPKLYAKKTCTVTFGYNEWLTKYKTTLEDLVKKYNEWQMYKNIEHNSSSEKDCGSKDAAGYYSEYTYNYHSNYTCFSVNDDGKTLKKEDCTKNDFASSCGLNDYSSESTTAEEMYDKSSIEINKLQNIINRCNNLIDFGGNNEDFYKPDHDLYFYYDQSVLNNSAGKNSIYVKTNSDEMKATSTKNAYTCSGNSTSNTCVFDEKYEYDTIISDNKYTTTVKIGDNALSRSGEFEYEYSPSTNYYVTPYTGVVNESSGIELGYVYNIDINAITKDDNENRFVFTKLGHDSSESSSLQQEILKNNGDDALTRECTYKTLNKIVECEETKCPKGSPSMNVVYRIVDPNNIDPNGRLGTDNGFKNWNNDNGKIVKEKIENTDTYNPDNLEYSFTLDSGIIKDIREYNKQVRSYSSANGSSELSCESDGNKCISKFIDEAMKSTPNLNGISTKQFATNNSGRSRWKTITKSGGNCYIDGVLVKNVICR